MSTDFIQPPPRLGNQYSQDNLLQEHLERSLPPELFGQIQAELHDLGALSGGSLYAEQQADRANEPLLTNWDAWGERVDSVSLSPHWQRARALSAQLGLLASAYEEAHKEHARTYCFAKNYLVQASLDVYSCPLAMTDGAAATIRQYGSQELQDRAIPRLLSRDPDQVWISGQWMTERIGGSDVGLSEARAVQDNGEWRLFGTKWFTSAVHADIALTLARPEGAKPGGAGLGVFYLERLGPDGRPNDLQVLRLKDKLGTRKLPTGEVQMTGTLARPLGEPREGTKKIATMLNITRTWNSIAALSEMRRAIALARDYAKKRVAFGGHISENTLHIDTMASLQAEFEGAFHLSFWVVDLLGRSERGVASTSEAALLRLLTPITKLTTARQGVWLASEAMECIGGAAYMNDSGFPRILVDMQALPIWEGTTNVLAMDAIRAIKHDDSLSILIETMRRSLRSHQLPALEACSRTGLAAIDALEEWMERSEGDELQAGARRFAMTLGRCAELSRAVEHAAWCDAQGKGDRAAAAARRLAHNGLNLLQHAPLKDSALLA